MLRGLIIGIAAALALISGDVIARGHSGGRGTRSESSRSHSSTRSHSHTTKAHHGSRFKRELVQAMWAAKSVELITVKA